MAYPATATHRTAITGCDHVLLVSLKGKLKSNLRFIFTVLTPNINHQEKPFPKKLHTVRNLHFLPKSSTLISREICRFFWVKNLVKMLWFWTF